jgi:enoyl-CoA hydratase/carnithine racemase
VQLAKEAVLAGMDAPLTSALALEVKSLQILFSSKDQKEGMRAFIEKRKPKFEGR